MLNTVETPPDRYHIPSASPMPPTVGTSAFPANQKFGQCIFSAVFSLRSYRLIGNSSFAVAPCHLRLHQPEGFSVNDCRVVIGNEVLRHLPAIFDNLFGNTIFRKRLLKQHIPGIPFICQNPPYDRFAPDGFPLRRQNSVRFQSMLDLIQAEAV